MGQSERERIVITGLGCVSALGDTPSETFERICNGESGIRELDFLLDVKYRYRFGGFVADEAYCNSDNKALEMTRKSVLDALNQAGLSNISKLEREQRERIGFFTGTLCGMNNFPFQVSDNTFLNGETNADLEDCLYDELNLLGSKYILTDACCTSLNLLHYGFDHLLLGKSDIVVCVATELLTDYLQCTLGQLRALSKSSIKPFDKARNGTVLGEGSATIVMETLEHAKKRNACILAEVGSIALGCEASDMAAPEQSGKDMCDVMRRAIVESNVSLEDVQYINAHGTATKINDSAESKAINMLFQENAKNVFVSSTKSSIGHMCAAAGLAESVICVMALLKNQMPPTICTDQVDEICQFPVVLEKGMDKELDVILTNSFGFGGNNASMVLKKISTGE